LARQDGGRVVSSFPKNVLVVTFGGLVFAAALVALGLLRAAFVESSSAWEPAWHFGFALSTLPAGVYVGRQARDTPFLVATAWAAVAVAWGTGLVMGALLGAAVVMRNARIESAALEILPAVPWAWCVVTVTAMVLAMRRVRREESYPKPPPAPLDPRP
jgi:hypothetical protein